MEELTQLLTNLAIYDNSEDGVLVAKVAQFAEKCHQGFSRLDGTPYILHPIAVATILSEWKAPPNILAAALLHDIFKMQYSHVPSPAILEAEFPPSLISLVHDVASLGELGPALIQKSVEVSAEQDQETDMGGSQRFLWANVILQQDPMAVVIKLADRLHNLQSRDALPEVARQEGEKWFAAAILNIFAPLANRMGMQRAKEMLEDGAFRIYNYELYAGIDSYALEVLRNVPIDHQISKIKQILQKYTIEAKVLKRLKHRYAIFRQQLASASREVAPADTFSIVIVVKSVDDCYLTLGVVHSIWRTFSEVYNYIATPRPNGYRALHMRAFEPSIGTFNVVILTEAMHLVAEHGITAGWLGVCKELLPEIKPLPERPSGHIMAITPKGDVKYLPKGATAIDFAYSIHEEMGHRCMQVWVNGNQAPLEALLEEGSVVDIIVSRGVRGPSRDWLQHVVTDTAREAIERWVQQQIYLELVVEGTDRVRLLEDVIDCISMKGINMFYLHAEVNVNKAIIRARMQVIGTAVLEEIEQEINGLPQVTRARWEKFTEATHQDYPHSIAQSQSSIPYSIATPVVGRDFKGRGREVQEVVDRLRGYDRSNALLIWGQQRIGKTSLLLHLEKDVLQNETYLIVFITLHEVEGQPIGNFLHRIALEIQRKIQREEVRVPHPRKMRREPIRYFQGFIDKLEQMFGPQSLLIILDEFQGIGTLKEEGATKQEVVSYFRSLVQHGMTVNFVFCGGGIPKHLLTQSGIGSLLAVVDHIKVGSLEKEAAIALVTELDQSLHYNDQAVERLLEVTDCHPCYLTFLCRELYLSRTQQSITLADVERVIGQAIEWEPKLEGILQHFWTMGLQSSELAKKHKQILSTIAAGVDSSRWMTFDKIAERTYPHITDGELPGLLANLTDYGSIDMNGSNYRVHIPILELWFRGM